MARGPSFGTIILRGIRAANRAEQQRQRAAIRAQAAAEREALRLQRRFAADLRAREREARADAREAAREHVAAQVAEAEELSQDIAERESEIANLLLSAIDRDPTSTLGGEYTKHTPRQFDRASWLPRQAAPRQEDYLLDPPALLERVLPWMAKRRKEEEERQAERFDRDERTYRERMQAVDDAQAKHERDQLEERAAIEAHNQAVEAARRAPDAGDHDAVVRYVDALLECNFGGEHDAIGAEVGYSPDSRHIVIDLELPDIAAIPEEASFRYVKSADRIDAVLRPTAKRKALYANLLAQIVLKCLDTIFRGVSGGAANCVTINGMLDSVNPASGHEERNCLISVRVTAEAFRAINLRLVRPELCLSALKASVSRSPADLLPVKPIVELNMVDSRFVDTTHVLSGLDARRNLMELTPGEFEGLITELFGAMGLETRQTQASRDGGVDCVAFDPRPVFGGKVVIQAKRYKNTVGVSAVRDLFGTMQNEGATKGILVTTSGYGQAAYEFANGKPLELLDGTNLLFLLKEHAKIDARIVMLDGWLDRADHEE